MKRLIHRFAFLLCLSLVFCAQMELVCRHTDGPACGLCKVGNIIYVAAGGSIISVDVSDPSHPIYLDHFQCGDLTDQPSVHNGLLITGANIYHYYAIDITNPEDLNCIWWYEPLENPPYDGSEWEFLGHCRIRDSLIYLAGHDGYNFFRIEDLHNPAHPETVAQIAGLDYNPHALAISQDYAFEVGGNCVWIFDISPPESTRHILTHLIGPEFETFFMPGIEVFNDTLVCVSHSTGVWAFTTRFLPDSLHLLWRFIEYLPADFTWDCWIDDSLIFTANQRMIRIGQIFSDSVHQLCAIPVINCCYDLVAEDGILYAADRHGGLVIYSYENPEMLIMLSNLDFGNETIDIVRLGDSLLVSRDDDGFVFYAHGIGEARISNIYDFGDYAMGKIDTAKLGERVFLYAASGENGFFSFAIDNDSIRMLGHYVDFLINGARTVLAKDDTLWVGCGYYIGSIPSGGKLQLFDVSNPSLPTLRREWSMPNVMQIVCHENRLYVLTLGELRVYRLLPDSLEFLGKYGGMADALAVYRCTAVQVARFGERIFAYVTHFGWEISGPDAFNGLYTFDVTNPSDTIMLIDADTVQLHAGLWYNRGAVNLKLVGSFLCLYDNAAGWYVFSLFNPANPDTIGDAYFQHNGNNNGYGLWFDPPYIYCCTGDDGFYMLRWDTLTTKIPIEKRPEGFSDIFAKPNPFNSYIQIDVYEGAKIEIFDIEGRLVWNLNDCPDVVQWQPCEDINSGIYLVRITKGKNVFEKRIFYIR